MNYTVSFILERSSHWRVFSLIFPQRSTPASPTGKTDVCRTKIILQKIALTVVQSSSMYRVHFIMIIYGIRYRNAKVTLGKPIRGPDVEYTHPKKLFSPQSPINLTISSAILHSGFSYTFKIMFLESIIFVFKFDNS